MRAETWVRSSSMFARNPSSGVSNSPYCGGACAVEGGAEGSGLFEGVYGEDGLEA